MPRWLAIVLLAALGLGVLGWVFRTELIFGALFLAMEPGAPFAEVPTPPAPDYANPNAWAALPGRTDAADEVPTGIPRMAEHQAPVDVFFIHPTTYFSSDFWNQPLDDADTNERTDQFILVNQASAFNSCCRVFAPRYRQATMFSFMDESDSGPQALDLAYNDVTTAFEFFLANWSNGRPFILAAHSQGSRHLEKMLKVIDGSPLQERLVAAYPVGWFMDADTMAKDAPGIPPCASADQTGCFATWNAMAPGTKVPWADVTNAVCVNPLSWRTDGARADFAANTGGWGRSDLDTPPQSLPLEPGVADARCQNGILEVSEIRSKNFPFEMGPGNYHVYDYGLYWTNIYQNAANRVAAWVGTAQR